MPENEICWACRMLVRFYPESVPSSVLAEVAGADVALCDRHWSWWVGYWMSVDESPGCSAHLIGAVPIRTIGQEGEQ